MNFARHRYEAELGDDHSRSLAESDETVAFRDERLDAGGRGEAGICCRGLDWAPLEEMSMLNNHSCRAALMAGLAGAIIVIAGSAPGIAKETRQAALERCFAQARGSGDVVPGGAGGENRAAVYKDCMRKAGYKP
jgi:uncharacterized membrane protein